MKIFVAVVALCLTTAKSADIQAVSLVAPPIQSIVGGTNSGITPYIVSIASTSGGHFCGGSLIGSKTVLTAAHCCYGKTAQTLVVKYGGVDRNNLPIANLVTQVIIYPGYYYSSHDYDYCILRLAYKVVTSSTVQLIKVASSRPADGTQALLTGWGKTSGSSSTLPIYLQKVYMSIFNQPACNKKWINQITQRMTCATNKAASGCNGDSGGPLTVNGALVGIVSWGAAGCPADTTVRPTVYADPVTVATWISSYNI